MELQLEELESAATEDEIAAERAAGQDDECRGLHAQAPGAQALPRASAARAGGRAGADRLPCCGGARLRKLGEDVTETLEVIPRQWKVIQHVREKFTCRDCEKISQPPAPFHVIAARLGRAEPAGDDPVREVRPASAAEPSGRALRPGGRAAQPVDARRSGRRRLRRAGAAAASGSRPCSRRRAAARRRHDGAGAGQGQDRSRAMLDLRARRSAVRRRAAAGGDVLLLARPWRRASAAASGRLFRHAPGRRLWRLRQALCGRPRAGTDPGGGLLGPCAAAILRAGRYRGERPAQGARQDAGADLAAGAGGGAAHRCAVRRSSAPSTARAPSAAGGAPGTERAARRRSRRLDAGGARKLSRGNDLAKAMDYMLKRWAAVHPLPRRRTHLPHRTMPPNGPCAALLSAGSRGCSPAPIAAASVPPPCTA